MHQVNNLCSWIGSNINNINVPMKDGMRTRDMIKYFGSLDKTLAKQILINILIH